MPKTRDKFVTDILNVWKPRLLLQGWAVSYEFKEKDHPTSKDMDTFATISINSKYTEAKINIYPAFWKKPIAYRKSTLIHEMAHMATEAVRDALIKAMNKKVITTEMMETLSEGITEYIAKIMVVAYTRKRKAKGYHL